MNNYLSEDKPEMPSKYLDLIEKYLLVAPYIARPQGGVDEILKPVLWHRDLHLNNIYIDLSTNKISDTIDWQGVSVAPLVSQSRVPRMFRHFGPLPLGQLLPDKPEDYNHLGAKDKLRADGIYESALCQRYYEIITFNRNPRHHLALTHNDNWTAPYIDPIQIVSGAWMSREACRLRSCLMAVIEHWHELGPQGTKCPIAFDDEEKALHNEEIENRGYVEQLVEEYQRNGILPANCCQSGRLRTCAEGSISSRRNCSCRRQRAKNRSLGWISCGPGVTPTRTSMSRQANEMK